jgi:hypothetical protein
MLLLQKLHSWVDLPKSAEFGHAITARGARVPALEWQAVFCAALFWASRQGPEALECVAAALLACGNVHVLMHAERVDQLVSQTHSQRLARWLYGQLPEQGFGTSGAAAEDLQAGLRNLSVHRNEQLRRTLYFRDVRNPDLLAALRQLSLVCGVSSSTRGLWSDISEPVLSLGSFQTTLLERMSAQDDWIRVANHTQALEVATFPVSWGDYEVFCPWHRTCRSSSLPSEQPVGWVSLNAAREYCCWLNDLAHMMGRPYRFLLPDCVVLDELSNNTGLRKSLDFEWCEWNLADFRTASSPTGVVFSAAEQSRRYAFEPGVNIGFRVCRQRIAEK